MDEERERFFSRLATIPGLRTMPSIGNWILIRVDDASDVVRKVNRRLTPGALSLPRHIPGAVRIPVREPKQNEEVFHALQDLMRRRLGAAALARLEQEIAVEESLEAI
jgi:histidinol-phosphate/aromatic aminotransferase/cobyric acid decarboxylase-like protein